MNAIIWDKQKEKFLESYFQKQDKTFFTSNTIGP